MIEAADVRCRFSETMAEPFMASGRPRVTIGLTETSEIAVAATGAGRTAGRQVSALPSRSRKISDRAIKPPASQTLMAQLPCKRLGAGFDRFCASYAPSFR